MITILLKDPCPEIKSNLAKFIQNLCKNLNKEIGLHSKGILNSLCLNLKHQHNKIRKITTSALCDLLLCENAGNLIDDCLPSLLIISNDKNHDVRNNFYVNVANLMNNLNIIYLRKYESNLLRLLLNGLCDDKEEIRKKTEELIEQCGNNRKKLAIELKEDVEKFLK
jgi:hypothetical protein